MTKVPSRVTLSTSLSERMRRSYRRVRPRHGVIEFEKVTFRRWLFPIVGAVLLTAPMWRAGSVLNLDLIIVDRVPLPSGFWGLGPALPRRVPLYVAWSGIAQVVGGQLAGKLVIFGLLVLTARGTAHLVDTALGRATSPISDLAGLAMMWSPFALNRLATGHLEAIATIAVVPWIAASAIRTGSISRRGMLAGALGGPTSAFSTLVLAMSIAARSEPGRLARVGAIARRWSGANVVWLVPGLIVGWQGMTAFAAPEVFSPRFDGPAQLLGLSLGSGYWDPAAELTRSRSSAIAYVSVVVIGLAARGWQHIDSAARRPLVAMLAGGFVPTLLAWLPGTRTLFANVAVTWWGAALREPHRLVGTGVAALLVLSVVGIDDLAPRLGWMSVLGASAVLSGPFLWGLDGTLQPVALPASWASARAEIDRVHQGTTLLLPWHEYIDLPFADGRRVLNPLPDFIGGDVLTSGDPEVGSPARENAEPRTDAALEIQRRWRNDQPVAALLAGAGVDWVLTMPQPGEPDFTSEDQPGLTIVVQSDTLSLYRVAGDAVQRREPRWWLSPLGRAEDSGQISRPWAKGWMAGWHRAERTPAGLLSTRQRGVLLWYWPTLASAGAWLIAARYAFVTRNLRQP